MIEEKKLLQRCIRGDPAAWDDFIHRYGRLIYYVAQETIRRHGLSATQADLDDVYGDVMMSLLHKNHALLRRFDPQYSFVNWLGMITKARCIDYYRKKGHFPLASSRMDEDSDEAPQVKDEKMAVPQEQMDRNETIQLLNEVLASMPARDRIIIKLFFFEEKKYREIAKMLKMSVGVVASNIFRAKAKLMKKLEDAGISKK